MRDSLRTLVLNYLKEIEMLGEEFLFFDRVSLPSSSVASATQEKKPYKVVSSLRELEALCKECKRCQLHKTRKNTVFGKGDEHAIMMLIGEAPGEEEDIKGEPFVGRAGKLLTKMLEAIELTRDDVYIANVLKCRPPGNRDPEPDEVESCKMHLKRQIEIINPELILALGRHAINLLLGYDGSLSSIRGNILYYNNIKVIPTYHPAALLYHESWKHGAWDDLRFARRLYDEVILKGGNQDGNKTDTKKERDRKTR